MQTLTRKSELVAKHQKVPPGMLFYGSPDAVRQDTSLLGYVSVAERAFREMKIDGVLFLDSRPVLYLKENDRPFTPAERIRLQKLFWNQGVANVLVLADPVAVYLYSGLTAPREKQPDGPETERALIEPPLALAEYAQRIQTLYHDLATGHFYEKHANRFNPDEAVDASLLKKLKELRDAFIKGEHALEIKQAHALIGRVLFLCYLLDRGIVSIGTPARGRTATSLLSKMLGKQTPDPGIRHLYDLFRDLKTRFNGNMFDTDLDAEQQHIRPNHLEKLKLFLGGHEVKDGQLSLWPYDFKMIPVETISAVYEDFLAAEAPGEKKEKGAFYTPRFLAEMVVDTAANENPDFLDGTFLDPACGSGIFIVILFNRMANQWIFSQIKPPEYLEKAEALQDILASRIRGMDTEETACRIACFSLYLAYLDFFDPPDIRKYSEETGRPLPKLLDYGDTPDRPQPDLPVIFKSDFIYEERLKGEKFNCIIGNPPWKDRGSKQLAQKFMEKAPEFLKDGGTGCLLLPTKMLQNQTDAFQDRWLRQVSLGKVIQLADYRYLLFQNAKCPAMIVRFKNASPDLAKHLVEFVAPKFNRDGIRKGVITVNPSSRTWIPLPDILAATESKTATVLWKRRLWGTYRDQKLLDLMQSLPPLSDLAGPPEEKKRWIKGQGFQPYYPKKAEENSNYPKPKLNPWSLEAPVLVADEKIQLVVFQKDTVTLGERLESKEASSNYLRRVPNNNLFLSPMVIVSNGFGKVAYCDFDVLFQDSLRSISGPKNDSDLLIFLSAYLRSSLARYFLFHASSSWGTERPKVYLDELLRAPFPLPDHEFVSSDAEKIVKQIAISFEKLRAELEDALMALQLNAGKSALFQDGTPDIGLKWRKERKERKRLVDAFQNSMEPLIYQYFGLTEQEIALVEDTIQIFEPSSTPSSWRSSKYSILTLDPLEKTKVAPYAGAGLKTYADTLTGTLNSWAQMEGSDYRVQAEGGTSNDTGLAMVTLTLAPSESVFRPKTIEDGLADRLHAFHSLAARERGRQRYERDIFIFEGKRIHIVRPNILLNWTRTAALNDAARIYGDIALAAKEI